MEAKEREGEKEEGTEGETKRGWKIGRVGEDLWPVPLVSLHAVTGPQSGIAGSGGHSPEIRVMEIPHFNAATDKKSDLRVKKLNIPPIKSAFPPKGKSDGEGSFYKTAFCEVKQTSGRRLPEVVEARCEAACCQHPGNILTVIAVL